VRSTDSERCVKERNLEKGGCEIDRRDIRRPSAQTKKANLEAVSAPPFPQGMERILPFGNISLLYEILLV
jgi:hypothetical protein